MIADAVTILPAGTPPIIQNPTSDAVWQLNINQPQSYDIYANWTAHPNRASNAKYIINHSMGSDIKSVNQKQNGGTWQSLGIYNLAANSQIKLSTNADGYVIADGLRFVPTANNQPSTSGVFYYHNNHLGTPQILTAENQQIVWQASYTPYGLAEISTELVINNIRLPGQYFDAETGLYYNYFRYYDPVIGRYITSDPIGLDGGINTFGYVGGNPIGFVDPLGLNAGWAAEAGWAIGRVTARPGANWLARQITGNATATVGTWMYDAMHAEEADNDNSCNNDTPSPDKLDDKINEISRKTGLTPKEVKDAIHKAKTNLPKGTGIRNPDVKVDTNTGEVYPKTPRGGIGDFIGNIFD